MKKVMNMLVLALILVAISCSKKDDPIVPIDPSIQYLQTLAIDSLQYNYSSDNLNYNYILEMPIKNKEFKDKTTYAKIELYLNNEQVQGGVLYATVGDTVPQFRGCYQFYQLQNANTLDNLSLGIYIKGDYNSITQIEVINKVKIWIVFAKSEVTQAKSLSLFNAFMTNSPYIIINY